MHPRQIFQHLQHKPFLAPILAGLLAGFNGAPNAEPRYPTNPQCDQDSILLSHDGIYAYHTVNAGLYWQTLSELQTYEPVVVDDLVLVGSSAGLVALAVKDGKIRWRNSAQETVFSPTVLDDVAFAGNRSGRIRALNVTTGEELWQRSLGKGWLYPPAICSGNLITGGQESTLWALAPTTGIPRWQRQLPQELVYRPVALGTNFVVVSTFDGQVSAIECNTGTVKWQKPLSVASFSPLAINDKVIVVGFDGIVRALESTTGRLLWQRPLPDRIVGNLWLSEGRIYAVTESRDLLVINPEQGQLITKLALSGTPIGGCQSQSKTSLIFLEGRNDQPPFPVYIRSSAR